MAAPTLTISVTIPAVVSRLAAATRTLDVLLPALGANTAARTRTVPLLEAVRPFLVGTPKTAPTVAVATVMVSSLATTASEITVIVATLGAVTLSSRARPLVHSDTQLATGHVAPGNAGKLLAGQISRDVHEGEGRVDFDVTDVAAIDASLARDCSNNGTRLHAVLLADLNAVARAGAGSRAAATAATSAIRAAFERAVLVASRLEGRADELAGLVQALLAANLSISAAILLTARRRTLVTDRRGHERGGDVLDAHLLAHVGQ